jgi:hypothetical protein
MGSIQQTSFPKVSGDMKGQVLRDNLNYLAIAFSIVAAIYIFATSYPDRKVDTGAMWLFANTAFIFGSICSSFKSSWKRRQFWGFLFGALILHCFVWISILIFLQKTPLFLLGLTTGPEFWLMSKAFDKWANAAGGPKRVR